MIVDAALDPLDVDAALSRQHRLHDDIESGAHHLVRDVELAAGGGKPARPRPLGGGDHGREEALEALAAEDRRGCAPLPTPACAVRRQDAFAERRRERAPHGIGLNERVGLVDEDLLDQAGIQYDQYIAAEQAMAQQRALVGLPRPELDRVSEELPHDAQRGQWAFRGRHLRGERSGSGREHVRTCV